MIKKNLTSSIILVMMLLITPPVSLHKPIGRSKDGQKKSMIGWKIS